MRIISKMGKQTTQIVVLALVLGQDVQLKAKEHEKDSSAARSGNLHLKVDLALPQWDDPKTPRATTAKEGWITWCSPRWADMYMHDGAWLPAPGEPKDSERGNISGTGVRAYIVAGGPEKGSTGALHAKGLCRANLAGGEPPYGRVQGEAIANTYYYACDWAGPIWGDVVLLFENLPSGEYTLKSYHNYWEPTESSERNCREADSIMPPMPSVTVHPFTKKLLQDHNIGHIPREEMTLEEVRDEANVVQIDTDDPFLRRKVIDVEGNPYLNGALNFPSPEPGYNGEGVEAVKNAYDVPVSSALKDSEVSTSRVRFKTDGHRVVVIYEAPGWEYKDRARPDRPGGRGVLNAFELKRVSSFEN